MQYYDNLIGPVSYKRLTGYNKTVHLFGDYHSKQKIKCNKGKDIDFTQYLDYHLTKSYRKGIIYDIFIEIAPVLKNFPIDEDFDIPKTVDFTVAGVFNSGLIEDLAIRYYGCMNKSNDIRVEKFIKDKVYNRCDFSHRFHNIDVRGLMTSDVSFFLAIRDIFEVFKSKGYVDEIVKLANKIVFIPFEEYITRLKIKKQLDNCEDDVSKKLFMHYKQMYMYERLNIIKSIKEKDSESIIKCLYLISGYMLDLYTISRLMRIFIDETTPKEIIIIAGNKHIENITKTLVEVLNFKLEKDVENNMKRCLPIKEIEL